MITYDAVILTIKKDTGNGFLSETDHPMTLDADVVDDTVKEFEKHYGKGNVSIKII